MVNPYHSPATGLDDGYGLLGAAHVAVEGRAVRADESLVHDDERAVPLRGGQVRVLPRGQACLAPAEVDLDGRGRVGGGGGDGDGCGHGGREDDDARDELLHL